MSSRTAVLVTGVGACGVGEGISKAVRMADRYSLVTVNADANAPELFESEAQYIVPQAHDDSYIPAIREICKNHSIKAILPGSEPETAVLAKLSEEFRNDGVRVLANPISVVETCQDKWLTHNFLSEAGLPTPPTFLVQDDPDFIHSLDLPLILKPLSGHASQDVYLIQSAEELTRRLDHLEKRGIELLAQQYIGGDQEFTCSALSGDDGEILGSIAMRRELMGGFSQWVEVGEFPAANELTRQIAVALESWGPINVQCRWSEGSYWVFEINARFSGSAPFRARVGFNEPDIMIRHALGEEPLEREIQTGVVGMRRLEEVIVASERYQKIERIAPLA